MKKAQEATIDLRWLADMREQSQRVRVSTGEQIRAILQGRDDAWGDPERDFEYNPDEEGAEDKVLTAIRRGDTDGPLPILGRAHRRQWEQEKECERAFTVALEGHPAWAWLSQVKGIGPTLAGKLLARLDVHKAPNISSFWRYCGLDTVPGERWRCEKCGRVRVFPAGYKVTGGHMKRGSKAKCDGVLKLVAGPDDGVRAARPKPAKSEKAPYDQYAKKIVYQIGSSFLKSVGGTYDRFYRSERAKVDTEHSDWDDAARHYWAFRKMEKLFLSHLWQVWRASLDLPMGQPYATSELGHEGYIDPAEMVE